MTDHEQKRFEARLRQLKPGELPEVLVTRLREATSPAATSSGKAQIRASSDPGWLQVLRWLVPATAAILISAIIWHRQQDSAKPAAPEVASRETAAPAEPLLKADNIEIGRELVSSFDAVATLPGGEPVRFRCQQWISKVVVDDAKLGLLIENRRPRVIVVPVGLETY